MGCRDHCRRRASPATTCPARPKRKLFMTVNSLTSKQAPSNSAVRGDTLVLVGSGPPVAELVAETLDAMFAVSESLARR